MSQPEHALFNADVWGPALEKYGAATHLTVTVYDAEGELACGPIHPTPLSELVAPSNYGDAFFGECVQRCLRCAPHLPAVIVVNRFGLAAVAAPLVLTGEVRGVAVAGYHFLEFPQSMAIERLAREARVATAHLWEVAQQETPLSKRLFVGQGELLQVFGETLLTEQHRLQHQVELTARLQAADAAKDQFLAVVSHELRGPLNAMLGWAQILRTGQLQDSAREQAIATIERNARAQARLIEDLLDISRILAGRMQIERQPVALVPIVQRAIETLSPAIFSKAIRLTVQLEDLQTPVTGDAVHLQQIVANLLSNAVKFTPSGGEVSIRLIGRGAEAELSVTDTGAGIRAEFLPHIFEPFRQQDSSTTRVHGGLGLGLTIVRHLVAVHGGSIRAHSPGIGQGATFIVKLPLTITSSSASSEHASIHTTSEGGAPPALLRDLHVLIVEDNDDARGLMQTLLEQAGAEVTAVTSADDALATLDRTQPDVLISDIGLPEEDGYALMRRIRKRSPERGGDIPAVAVTAWASAADLDRARSVGYDLHLAKPIDASQLVQAITSLVHSA